MYLLKPEQKHETRLLLQDPLSQVLKNCYLHGMLVKYDDKGPGTCLSSLFAALPYLRVKMNASPTILVCMLMSCLHCWHRKPNDFSWRMPKKVLILWVLNIFKKRYSTVFISYLRIKYLLYLKIRLHNWHNDFSTQRRCESWLFGKVAANAKSLLPL